MIGGNIVCTVLAVLLLGLSYAAARGWIGPNKWVGIRTAVTKSSREAWVVGHRAALPIAVPNLVAQVVLLVTAVCVHGRVPEFVAYVLTAITALVSVFLAQRTASDVEQDVKHRRR